MRNRNKTLIISAILFAIIAIVLLVVGFAAAGNDIISWLSSKYAVLFYIVFGTYALFVISILVGDWIKRL